MPISVDSPSDETLNQGPLTLLLRQQYEFLFGINILLFSIFKPFVYQKDYVTEQNKTSLKLNDLALDLSQEIW